MIDSVRHGKKVFVTGSTFSLILLARDSMIEQVHYHKTLLSAMDLVELQNHLLHMGYIVVNRADNPRCTGCTELTLMRVRCPGTGVYNQLS